MRGEKDDTMTSSTAVLELRRVSLSFSGLQVLRDVNLCIKEGERRVIIGPNGAGKTTLFNVISGFFPPSSGTVNLFGQEVTKRASHLRMRAGLGRTFQVAKLFDSLTVFQNVCLALYSPGGLGVLKRHYMKVSADTMDMALQLLDEWELLEKKDWAVRRLAYGEKRRLEIALVLATRPKVVLLDEPMAGLTTEERLQLAEKVASYPRDSAILLIDHDIEIALSVADWVSVLHLGEVIAEGLPSQIRENGMVQRVYLGMDEEEAGHA